MDDLNETLKFYSKDLESQNKDKEKLEKKIDEMKITLSVSSYRILKMNMNNSCLY